MVLEGEVSPLQEKVFGHLWKSLTPSKVVAFSWQLLRDRIPTRQNLLLRKAIDPQSSQHCVFCDEFVET